MTIQSATARVSFPCDSVSNVFPVNIQAYLATDFLVLLTNAAGSTKLNLNSDYTLVASGSLTPTFWSLTTQTGQFVSPYVTGNTLQVILNPSETQLSQYTQGQAFPSLAVQTNLDRLTQMVIREGDQLSRAITAPDGDVSPAMLLPAAALRASTNLGFDLNGNLALNLALASGTISTATLAPFLNLSRTTAEVAAGVTPANLAYPPGNVLRYGADPTGVADSTAAINSALLCNSVVYLPSGTYKVTNALTLVFANQVVIGDELNTTIAVASTFNLSATGVFVGANLGSPDHGPWFENLRITCDQSQVASSGTRANLRLYPPAIYVRGSPRWRVLHCRIELFTFGIDSQGSTPGGVVDDLEIGCFSCGLAIDGSGDTTRISNMHFIWFNSWTANQMAIISDGNTVGVSAGRCDGLDAVNSLFFTPAKGINTFLGNGNNQVVDPVTAQALAGNGGSPWLTGFTTGQIANCGFDTYGGIYENGAGTWLLVTGCYFSANISTPKFIVQTAGVINCANCRFEVAGGPPNPAISLSNVVAATNFAAFVGCFFQSNFDQTLISITGNNPIEFSMASCEFSVAANLTNTNTLVSSTNSFAGGGVTFVNNRFTPKGTGSGTALSITTASKVIVTSNVFNSWSISTPAGAVVANNL